MIAFTVGFLLPLKILVAFLQAFIFCMLPCSTSPARPRTPSTISPFTPHKEAQAVRRSLMLTLITWSIVAVPGLAFAATDEQLGGPFAVLAAGLGMGLASGLCGLGQGRAGPPPWTPSHGSPARRRASRPS